MSWPSDRPPGCIHLTGPNDDRAAIYAAWDPQQLVLILDQSVLKFFVIRFAIPRLYAVANPVEVHLWGYRNSTTWYDLSNAENFPASYDLQIIPVDLDDCPSFDTFAAPGDIPLVPGMPGQIATSLYNFCARPGFVPGNHLGLWVQVGLYVTGITCDAFETGGADYSPHLEIVPLGRRLSAVCLTPSNEARIVMAEYTPHWPPNLPSSWAVWMGRQVPISLAPPINLYGWEWHLVVDYHFYTPASGRVVPRDLSIGSDGRVLIVDTTISRHISEDDGHTWSNLEVP